MRLHLGATSMGEAGRVLASWKELAGFSCTDFLVQGTSTFLAIVSANHSKSKCACCRIFHNWKNIQHVVLS